MFLSFRDVAFSIRGAAFICSRVLHCLLFMYSTTSTAGTVQNNHVRSSRAAFVDLESTGIAV